MVHITEGVEALTRWSEQLSEGQVPEHPFLLLGQYDCVDPTRHPAGASSAWAYTHVPQHITGDAGQDSLQGRWDDRETNAMAERMEREVEALAPGFRSLILKRHIAAPRDLQAADQSRRAGTRRPQTRTARHV